MKNLNYFDTYIVSDNFSHTIYESVEEYCCHGTDIDKDGQVDEKDFSLYLDSKVEKLNHADQA